MLFYLEIYMRSKVTLRRKFFFFSLFFFFPAKSTLVLCDNAKLCSHIISEKLFPIEVAILRKDFFLNRTMFRNTNLFTIAVAKLAIFIFAFLCMTDSICYTISITNISYFIRFIT